MKKARKALLTLCAALLLVTMTVTATIAYLTDTAIVTNSFSVGNVKITMDEAPVDDEGVKKEGTRVYANNYKLMPNKRYDKDPIIHVAENSESSWIFIKVQNGIAAIEDTSNTIASQITANGWTATGETGVYYKEYTKTTVAADRELKVFETFKIASDVDVATLATYENKQVIVTAYAVQKDQVTTVSAAWDIVKDLVATND